MKKLSCLSLLFMLLVTTACTSLDNASVESLLSAKQTREESFASTQEAYLLYPEDERVLYNYAYMLLYYGQYEDAVRICDEALALSPRSLRFLYLKVLLIARMYAVFHELILCFRPVRQYFFLTSSL